MPEYAEIDADLLLLAAQGGDYDKKEIVARIQDMTKRERQILRAAITTLDECYDEAVLDLKK
jgi:hypothetical protein